MVQRQISAINIFDANSATWAFNSWIARVVKKDEVKKIVLEGLRVAGRYIADHENTMDVARTKDPVEFKKLGVIVLDDTDKTVEPLPEQLALHAQNYAAKEGVVLRVFRLEKNDVVPR
jgi:hypothetical protein